MIRGIVIAIAVVIVLTCITLGIFCIDVVGKDKYNLKE